MFNVFSQVDNETNILYCHLLYLDLYIFKMLNQLCICGT